MNSWSVRTAWVTVAFLVKLVFGSQVIADEPRKQLRRFVEEQRIQRLNPEPFEITKKFILGRALFFDPLLSGNKDTACATCHLLNRGTSDGRARSIGPGGHGLGPGRTQRRGKLGPLANRNSLALWNRDDESVTSLFWDGRVEVLDPAREQYRTPLGGHLPTGFENVLAVQAVMPIVVTEEMKGYYGPTEDASYRVRDRQPLGEQALAIYRQLLERLLGRKSSELSSVQREYRALFEAAYPDVELDKLNITYVGNAIAHFEEVAFATRDSRWEEYLSGNNGVLTDKEVDGALEFFTKHNCSVCHNGPAFSDYKYHSLGIKSLIRGGNGTVITDEGRFRVTGRPEDKFRFRTPSLRNVTLTGPYMHDGSVEMIEDAIKRHYLDCEREDAGSKCARTNYSRLLEQDTVPSMASISSLVAFLGVLEDDALSYRDFVIPNRVPSGLSVDAVGKAEIAR